MHSNEIIVGLTIFQYTRRCLQRYYIFNGWYRSRPYELCRCVNCANTWCSKNGCKEERRNEEKGRVRLFQTRRIALKLVAGNGVLPEAALGPWSCVFRPSQGIQNLFFLVAPSYLPFTVQTKGQRAGQGLFIISLTSSSTMKNAWR